MYKHLTYYIKKVFFSACALFVYHTHIEAQNKEILSRDVSLNWENIAASLNKTPITVSPTTQIPPVLINLPLPDGQERVFKVEESQIMSEEFAALYPNFKTYSVVAADNPQVSGRMSVTPYGVNAFIFTEKGILNIRPRDLMNPEVHQVYFGSDDLPSLTGNCQFDESLITQNKKVTPRSVLAISNGATRRTYRMAIVTTGEFGAANGGSTGSASSVVVASVNAIQAIYDRELSVRFTLLTPFIFLDPATDDFDPATGSSQRTVIAAQSVAAHFTDINSYDIGHVLHNQIQSPAAFPGGGIAGLGAVCINTSNNLSGTGPFKAAAWSGSFDNISSGWYGLFAHEVGHQFNMQHTFNGTGGSCTAAISSTTAYEIGSGNSIMSYNGICDAAQNIPSGGTADQYFHANSLEAAVTFISSTTCQTSVATGNTPPIVNANPCGGATTIPMNTPFTLTGSGSDANGDVIFYSWEEYDEDGAGTSTQGKLGATAAASTVAPLFRSFPPTTSPSRTFPQISSVVVNGYQTDFEALPTVARTINFRLTGRDYNSNGGGIHSVDLAVTVSGAAFTLTAPNGGQTLSAGNTTTVTWDVGGTTGYCTSVNIKLSTDGGLTYPYTLATGTANDGTEAVTLPAGLVNVTTARMKVESATSTCVVFFDISNANFTITSTCDAPATTISPATPLTAAVNSASLNLGLTNNIGSIVTSFAGTLANTDNAGTLYFLDNTPATCANGGNSTFYDTYTFSVDVTGSYTINHGGSFGTVINLYSSPFTGINCVNFVASSATRPSGSGNLSLGNGITVSLTAKQLYVIVISSFSSGFPTLPYNYSITFPTKPNGANIYNGVIMPAGYSYIYTAVNSTTNNVTAVSATSNFTSLPVGVYNIYGAAYYSGTAPPQPAAPASWVGTLYNLVLLSNTCQNFSSNLRSVTVTSALPVELLSLQAVPLNHAVELTWQTATEINNKGFQIERKQTTGDVWDVLGFVNAKGSSTNYSFMDNSPLNLNYYRLKQIDIDGSATYSKIVSAAMEGYNTLRVYPNPVSDVLTLENAFGGDLHVLNLLGQEVISSPSARGTQRINVSTLPQGIYFLKVGIEQVKFTRQ